MSAPSKFEERIFITACAVVLGYLLALGVFYGQHVWLIDAHGHPLKMDFVAFWAAGRLASAGHAMSAYDSHLQHAAEAAVLGHNFNSVLGWSYPPLFLFVAAALSFLPYFAAFGIWCLATLALYAVSVSTVRGNRQAAVYACAAPWVLTLLLTGQNGFLTAALIGFTLSLLETEPVVAGIVLGLLSYKPQFGILFPLALAAGGYWRTFFVAAASTLLFNAAACAVFGTDTLAAFFHELSLAGQNHLNGGLSWNKLQSIYGLLNAMHIPRDVAWFAQGFVTLALAGGVIWIWRSPFPYTLKAAFLTAAIPLATPYVFHYDLPVLSIAIAFLARQRAFDRTEILLLLSTVPTTFGFLLLQVPTAFLASVAVMAIVLRRVWRAAPASAMSIALA